MKISRWVNLIGILCIIFGAYRIMSGFLELLMANMGETPAALIKPIFLIYIGIFVNMAYLTAGIFFLMKRAFSLNVMYFALTFKILYGITSLLFIEFPEFPILNIVSELVKPLFNAAMLIGVWKLAKYYFRSPEELAELSNKKTRRIIFTQHLLKLLSFAGILFLSVPAIIFILWIYSSMHSTTQAESVSLFNSFLPAFLQGRYDSTYLSVVFCLIGIVIGAVCLKLHGKVWITLNVSVLVLCSLMMLLNLWSLM